MNGAGAGPLGWSLKRRLLIGLVAGLLANGAFPPLEQSWLAWIALTLLVLALSGVRGRDGALVAGGFGVAYFGVLLHWIAGFGLVAWAPLVLLQAAYLVGFGALAARAWGLSLPLRALAIGAMWSAFELTRATVPLGGFGWGGLGYSQVHAPAGHLARLGGVHLVSAVVVAGAVLLGAAVTAGTWRARAQLLAAAAVLGLAPGLLPVGLAGPVGETIDVAAVQGNVSQGRFARIGRAGERTGPEDFVIIDNHLEVTSRLLQEEDRPDLIVWPENSIDRDPQRIPQHFAQITSLVRRLGVHMIAGTILEGGNHFTNSNLLIDPSGVVADRYDKVHLVPFGEYVPLAFARDVVPLLNEEIPIDGRPGRVPHVLDVGGVRVGSVICFESTYGPLVRSFVERGAELIVVTTNNASFGTGPAARQHLDMSRMRALETGRAVVHDAIAGISAMVLPDGTVIDSAGLFVPALLRARLPLASVDTPYTVLGRYIEISILVAALVAALAVMRPRSRGEEDAPSEPA